MISVEGELYKGRIEKVSLPTQEGMITILPGHVNMVTPLEKGKVLYMPVALHQTSLEEFTEKEVVIEVQGGMAMIENDIVTVVAE